MLLRLQHLKPDGLELRDDRINFLVEIFAHGRKRRNNLLLLGGTIQMNECVIFAGVKSRDVRNSDHPTVSSFLYEDKIIRSNELVPLLWLSHAALSEWVDRDRQIG